MSALLGDRIYVGIGRYLYRSVAVTAGSWSSLTQVADLGAGVTITALAYYRDELAVCCGATRSPSAAARPATSRSSTPARPR